MTVVPYSTGLMTTLVVDAGWHQVRVLAMSNGSYLREYYTTQSIGSLQICGELQDKVISTMPMERKSSADELFDARSLRTDTLTGATNFDMLEDMLIKCCLIQEGDVPSVDYTLLHTNTTVSVDGPSRSAPRHILFQATGSVASCVLDAVLKCPIDSRKMLLQNIVVVGGTSMIPGFRVQLHSEMRMLIQQEKQYAMLQPLLDQINLVTLHFKPNMIVWCGASVYSTFDVVKNHCITRQEFEARNGHLPDWMSI